MAYPYVPPLQSVFITTQLADVSAPSTVFVVPGFTGRIKKVWSVLNNAITLADSALSLAIGANNVTGGSWTVPFTGSAAGTVNSAVPTGANVFQNGDAIKITTDGGSTTTSILTVTLEVEPV
jgi:hypothetical protein